VTSGASFCQIRDTWDSHVHLESSLRLRAAGDTDDVLNETVRLREVLQTFLDGEIRAGARELDVRINPLTWRRRGVAWPQLRDALREHVAEASSIGVTVRVWFTVKRDASRSQVSGVLRLASDRGDLTLAGFDISSSYSIEDAISVPAARPPLSGMKWFAEELRRESLALAIHCGAYDPPRDIATALESLGAVRIGHALPLARSDRLIRLVADSGAIVEVSATAAARQGVPTDSHPIRLWVSAGVRVAAGSDHPLALGTDLRSEVAIIRRLVAAAS
jgi:adenosine deaminase